MLTDLMEIKQEKQIKKERKRENTTELEKRKQKEYRYVDTIEVFHINLIHASNIVI